MSHDERARLPVLGLENYYSTDRGRPLDPRFGGSTMSNCRRVEKHFGSLDQHFQKDGGARQLQRRQAPEESHRDRRNAESVEGRVFER